MAKRKRKERILTLPMIYQRIKKRSYKVFGCGFLLLILFCLTLFCYVLGDTLYPFRYCVGYWIFLWIIIFLVLTLIPIVVYLYITIKLCQKRFVEQVADQNQIKSPYDPTNIVKIILVIILFIIIFSLSVGLFCFFILVLEWSADTRPQYSYDFTIRVSPKSNFTTKYTINRDSNDIPHISSSSTVVNKTF
jgi:hypothetical protein